MKNEQEKEKSRIVTEITRINNCHKNAYYSILKLSEETADSKDMSQNFKKIL